LHIQVDQVLKRFGDKTVLQDVTVHVQAGEFVALLGPSGCGKTTLLNALAGLLDVDGGSIAVAGETWSKKGYTRPPEQRSIGMVFQDFALWPHMSVYENVAFGLKLKKLSAVRIRDRVRQVLDTVQMVEFEQRYPHQLSGGQKQRIAIARALAPNPTVLLMDEPLSSLDAKLREQMRWDLLSIIQQAGITTIYVTHDQVEALSMADRIILLNEGKKEQEGSPTELYNSPNTVFTAAFLGASNLLVAEPLGHEGNYHVVDCAGLKVFACSAHKPLAGQTMLHIRPSDIQISPSLRQQTGPGQTVAATVMQRAFQGTTWQYRLQVSGPANLLFEVWDHHAWDVGTEVSLWLDAKHCLLVQGRPSVHEGLQTMTTANSI